MKVLLDIEDDRVDFVMELLEYLPFIKTQILTSHKAQVLANLRAAMEEMHLVKDGKLKARGAEELFNEL